MMRPSRVFSRERWNEWALAQDCSLLAVVHEVKVHTKTLGISHDFSFSFRKRNYFLF